MKNIILFMIFIFSNFISFSQENEFEVQKQIYEQAKIYNDPGVAINSLYKMISLQPNNIDLLDSLLREYLGVSRWPSVYMVSRDLLSKSPNNLFALEVSCMALQNLGLKQQALNEYETLYLKTDRIDVLYTIAFLQYELKNYNESMNNLNILLENKLADSIKVNVTKGNNSTQEIEMKSQLFYLKGIIFEEKNDKGNAIIQFKNALKLSPNFENALNKLNE